MVKISTIFALGIFVVLIQYLGIPADWKNNLYILSGIFIVALSVMIRKELNVVLKHLHDDVIQTDTFTENTQKQGELLGENKLF
jgi:hypothetical protein